MYHPLNSHPPLSRRQYSPPHRGITKIYQAIILPFLLLLGLAGALVFKKWRDTFFMRLKKINWPSWVGQMPTLWIHCSSGEFEYAKPLIREWKSRYPEWKIVVTYFSPSFRDVIQKTKDVDFSLPLPLDFPGPMTTFLRRLRPSAVAVSRTDLWPQMCWSCYQHKVPVVLFSATKPSLQPWEKLFKTVARWRYEGATEIWCVSEQDKKNFTQLGIRRPVQALGDTRFDQVFYRLSLRRPTQETLKPINKMTLVAGSTWPEDEKEILKATQKLILTHQLRVILVPHEPTPHHLDNLTKQIESLGLGVQMYSQSLEWPEKSVLVVDQLGILAELYQWGQIALVGGSFRKSVHSVMEPLAAGLITFVGPYFHNNREALQLSSIPLHSIPPHFMESKKRSIVQPVQNGEELGQHLHFFLQNSNGFPLWKQQILQEVSQHQGATGRVCEGLANFAMK